jgi:hypothetical protein
MCLCSWSPPQSSVSRSATGPTGSFLTSIFQYNDYRGLFRVPGKASGGYPLGSFMISSDNSLVGTNVDNLLYFDPRKNQFTSESAYGDGLEAKLALRLS